MSRAESVGSIGTRTGRRIKQPVICLIALLVLSAPTAPLLAQGGGVVIYETGSIDMAHSAAGAGARAEDAATAFYNPAGMTLLDDSQVMIGTMAIFSELKLDLNNGHSTSVPPGNTNGGGYQGHFTPGLGSFGVVCLTDELRFGIAVTALAAAGVDYDRDWIGATFITKNQVIVANLMPSLAYRVIDSLSLGASLNVLYTSLDQDLQASSASDAPTIKIDQADDWALAGTFSLMFEPGKLAEDVEFLQRTRMGFTYRTEADFDLKGDLLNPTPLNLDVEADWTVPQGLNVSVYHQLTPRLALLADAGWTDWSAFDRQGLDVSGGGGATIPRNWDDTWRVGIGAAYAPWDAWTFRTGFSYDSSPVDDDERLPDIPVGEQLRFSLGVERDFGEGKKVGVAYTLMYTPMDMDEVALPGGVIVDGDYDRAFVHFVGLSLNVAFGGTGAPAPVGTPPVGTNPVAPPPPPALPPEAPTT